MLNSIKLKELRTNKQLTQVEMSALLTCTPRNYQRYEAGSIDIPLSKAVIIANFFDVSLDYLIDRTDNPNSHKL